jgi:CHAT domain-containing protein/tetratricopeptide (TPR) repeat protein
MGLELLAQTYEAQDRFLEAERLFRRNVEFRRQFQGPAHVDLCKAYLRLGFQADRLGRPEEAVLCYLKSIAIAEKNHNPTEPYAMMSRVTLADLARRQGQFGEAEALYKVIISLASGSSQTTAQQVGALSLLAHLYEDQGRYREAEPLVREAVAVTARIPLGIMQQEFNADHQTSLAGILRLQGRLAEAEGVILPAIRSLEQAYGSRGIALPSAVIELARITENRGHPDQAGELLDRVIAQLGDPRPADLVYRSRLRWKLGRREQALADLSRAMELVEARRKKASTGERERAYRFADSLEPFDQAVIFLTDLGDAPKALEVVERSRAQAMLDRMEASGLDPLAGVPAAEAELLRGRERRARLGLAKLEQQRRLPVGQPQPKDLADQAAEAREAWLRSSREILAASPSYRLSLGRERRPADLAVLRRDLLGERGLLLEYVLNPESGFVIVVPGTKPPRIVRLEVGRRTADLLGIESGPFTLDRSADALASVTPSLLTPDLTPKGLRRLASLSALLIPERERNRLAGGDFDRVVVVPDGPIAQLPFEALVLDPGAPRFLLDLGTPVLYGPSATTLANLAARAAEPARKETEPVLTIGDVVYDTGALAIPPDSAPERWSESSRYRGGAGKLDRLVFSRDESNRLARAFRARGIAVKQLLGDQAVEPRVRSALSGRRIVHLACHGWTDLSYGNLFGALAITPGPRSTEDPNEDGLLTLGEWAQIDLRSCDLAILSACETNLGPPQRGEGMWALSRGLLVAGARRVVASNWRIEDESTAELIGAFAERIANHPEGTLAYARALSAAKRRIRAAERWASPHYWSAFVLIGPP